MAGRARQENQAVVKEDENVDQEYKYYCILIRDLEPFMPENQQQREKLMRWIHLLVDPLTSLQEIEFRQKRNRYLFMICTSLMTGNQLDFMKIAGGKHLKFDAKRKPIKVAGIPTPEKPEPIADAQGIPRSIARALDPKTFDALVTYFDWQREKCWDVRLQKIQEAEKIILKDPKMRIQGKTSEKTCTVHLLDKCPCNNVEKKIRQCLDNQFKYLLTLAEAYQLLMESETGIINSWLQALAKINPEACTEMKGIRNDYMMLLVGYLVNKELKGPFEDLPTERLPPLTQAIATYIEKRKKGGSGEKEGVPLNPVSDTIEAFMNHVPKIEEGAFAFLSLSGNLFAPQH